MNEENVVDRLCIIAANIGLIIDSLSPIGVDAIGAELNDLSNDIHNLLGELSDRM